MMIENIMTSLLNNQLLIVCKYMCHQNNSYVYLWNEDKKIKTLNRAYTFSQHGLSQAYKLKKKKNK